MREMRTIFGRELTMEKKLVLGARAAGIKKVILAPRARDENDRWPLLSISSIELPTLAEKRKRRAGAVGWLFVLP